MWFPVYDSDIGTAPVSYTLAVGTTRIDIALREEGSQLDKLFLTLDGSIPSGLGPPGTNCSIDRGVDTDGDGIVDLEDEDDDNDGIPDILESPTSKLVLSESVIISGGVLVLTPTTSVKS